MSAYDIEHSVPPSTSNTVGQNSGYGTRRNIPDNEDNPQNGHEHGQEHQYQRRPDFSTFFSHLNHTDTSNTSSPGILPMSQDVSAAYRLLAEAYGQLSEMRSDEPNPVEGYGEGEGGGRDRGAGAGQSNSNPLNEMIISLVNGLQNPPLKVSGVGQDFIDSLDRVDRKSLRKDMDCSICGNAFLDDQYPLVVRLPCNDLHMFDLECIAPWLKLNSTCPLDRKNLISPNPTTKSELNTNESESDGEYDEMYA